MASEAMDVTARLLADTASFDEKFKASGSLAEATSRQIERASERARTAWQKEIVSQERAEEAARKTARAKELAALQDDIRTRVMERQALVQEQLTLGLGRWVSAVSGASVAVNAESVALNGVAAAHMRAAVAANSHAISERSAASAAVRLLEGQKGIRAVEAFMTMIPGVGAALQAVFPVIGATMFIGLIVRMGEEFKEWEEKASQSAAKIKKDFGELNQELRVSNMEMAVSNDKLEDEIAKLEKHPDNGLRTGLDEAQLAAEKLAASLDKDIDRVKKLTEENRVGFWAGMISGKGQTKDTSNLILYAKKQVDDTRHEYDTVVAQARSTGDKGNVAQAETARLVALQKAYAKADQVLAGAQWAAQSTVDFRGSDASAFGNTLRKKASGVEYSSGDDNSDNVNLLAGARRMLVEEQEAIGQAARKGTDEARKSALDGAKNIGEASRKAAEEQMKAFEAQLAALKNDHKVSTAEEYGFWEDKITAAKRFPENLQKIAEKTGNLYQKMSEEDEADLRKFDEAARRKAEALRRWDTEASRLMDEIDRAEHRGADGISEAAEAQVKNAEAMREMVTAHEVATGAISRHDAAMIAATSHAAVYRAELKRLDEEAQHDANDSSLTLYQRIANFQQRGKRRQDIEGQMARTSRADQWAVDQTTVWGSAKQAIDQFVASARDGSRAMAELVSTSLASVNRALVDEVTGRGGNWSNVGRGVATNVAVYSINRVEGSILGGLGFGKHDGSSETSAIWVRMASLGAGAVSKTGGFLSKVAGLIPGFAEGGDVPAGTTAWVGERGPELVHFGSGAHVTPHNALGIGGSSWSPTVNVDARGSNDPAAVEAAARRAVMAAAPHIVTASMSQMKDNKMRTPSTQR